jgi:hypothetical protein
VVVVVVFVVVEAAELPMRLAAAAHTLAVVCVQEARLILAAVGCALAARPI